MKIFYHSIDDDGRCAGAVVNTMLNDIYGSLVESDCIGYRHGENLIEKCKEVEFINNEKVYIVDLALDDQILYVIRKAYESGCQIFHFDHHDSSLSMFDNLSDEDKDMMNHITKIYDMGISGCLITYIFSCMSSEERKDIDNVKYDLTDDRSHIQLTYKGASREYGVPIVIRYIDDNDTWRHAFNETKYFCIAFNMEEDKAPLSSIWDDLLFNSNYRLISKYINDGELLYKYQESQSKKLMRNSFVTKIDGIDVLCINACMGNSRLFGDEFNKYPAVCKFGYDGSIHKWIYTLYCSDVYDPEKKIDLSLIAKSYGGGGHKHACGFQLDYNMFEIV